MRGQFLRKELPPLLFLPLQKEKWIMDELKKLSVYCEKFTSTPLPVLLELERETHLKTLAPQMLTGRLQGQFLALISKLVKPKVVLEIGTFTGYGAICLAQGVEEGGSLYTIEVNPELSYLSKKYFEKAKVQHIVRHCVGDAKEIIPVLNKKFDIVYLDAGKHDYGLFFDLVIEKINPGGILLADNVLWSGKVVEEPSDKDANRLDAFNQKVLDDHRVENMLLPIRDGIMVAQKK